MGISRRLICQLALAAFATSTSVHAQNAKQSFPQWVEAFRARARARGISDATYSKVMDGLKPDISVYTLNQNQDEFREEVWQYLNRRVSEWRITTGRERSRQHEPLLTKLEREFGVDRFILLGLWGMETAFGDIIDNMKHMRPVFPALAALAWGEPRRRAYWEQELLNALVIVERNWSNPKEMIGSWAGAMGHTQWMPEVWLNIGADYDGDGRASPFGRPDDALAGTSRYLIKRGNYRRGEGWGFEARLPNGFNANLADNKTARSLAAWAKLGVVPAANQDNPPNAQARLWHPVAGGPGFLLMQNFYAVRTYNPSMNYTLAIVHLADRIRGLGPLSQSFPGAERAPTLAEVQEIQRRLTASGFDTDGVDGRVGRETMRAVRAFQNKTGLAPADGYAGLKVLARLRQKGS